MDVDNNIDNDFDGKFFDAFMSMGTTDRDDLIAEFQAVLGNNINRDSCAFFLDMNNWNLQNAVSSYYELEQQPPSAPLFMLLMADTTAGHPASVAPNTVFYRSWRIKNSGAERWPPGCHLRYYGGTNLASCERKMVSALSPGEELEVRIEMRSPPTLGSFLSTWKMSSPTGCFFGDDINAHIVVEEGGLLGITQQMARVGPEGCQLATLPSTVVHSVGPVLVAGNISNSAMDMEGQQGSVIYNRLMVSSDGLGMEMHIPHPAGPQMQNEQQSSHILDEDTDMS